MTQKINASSTHQPFWLVRAREMSSCSQASRKAKAPSAAHEVANASIGASLRTYAAAAIAPMSMAAGEASEALERWAGQQNL
mmetsp:Transcript_11179/g.8713  ORF Transcript_11179/g.8713 Transcript_11179/m.8713 type:complete len:82 (+) Transcript_11179:231-476(+)